MRTVISYVIVATFFFVGSLQNGAFSFCLTDFCQIATAFQERIQTATDTAKKAREERKVGHRFRSFAKNVNPWQLLSTIVRFAVGRWLFECGILVSMAFLCVCTWTEPDNLRNNPVECLFALQVWWWLMKNTIIGWVWSASWWTLVPLSIFFALNRTLLLSLSMKCLTLALGVASVPGTVLRSALNATGITHFLVTTRHSSRELQGLVLLCIYTVVGFGVKLWLLPLVVVAATFGGTGPIIITKGLSVAESSSSSVMDPMEKARRMLDDLIETEADEL